MSARRIRYSGGPLDGQWIVARANDYQVIGTSLEMGRLSASGVYRYDPDAGVFRWQGDLVTGLDFMSLPHDVLERIADPDVEWTRAVDPDGGGPTAHLAVEHGTERVRYSVNPRPGSTDTVDGLIRDIRQGAKRVLARRRDPGPDED